MSQLSKVETFHKGLHEIHKDMSNIIALNRTCSQSHGNMQTKEVSNNFDIGEFVMIKYWWICIDQVSIETATQTTAYMEEPNVHNICGIHASPQSGEITKD